MEVPTYVQIMFLVVVIITAVLFGQKYLQKPDAQELSRVQDEGVELITTLVTSSERQKIITDTFTLPIKNIVPTEQLAHSITLDEIRQGCSKQHCIPSVDDPEFISAEEATTIIDSDQIGIALSYKSEDKFYPFSMLVTREIVNDVVAGDALLVTYCPLCGTGIVFNRTLGGVAQEFGVSGMLWQSNLLMYNRAANEADRNLWSQVLGEAVVGNNTGVKLSVISSDIMQFNAWQSLHPSGEVLTTGSQRDPYGGEYFEIAQRFAPNFNTQTSPLSPNTYVYGVEVNGAFKAYPRDLLSEGEIHDMINDEEITITTTNGTVIFSSSNGKVIADVEGFWFSWVAAHPDTALWSN